MWFYRRTKTQEIITNVQNIDELGQTVCHILQVVLLRIQPFDSIAKLSAEYV